MYALGVYLIAWKRADAQRKGMKMSITDRAAANEYNDAIGEKLGQRAKWVAGVTDRLMGDLVKGFHKAGLKFPGDDRCFNLEVAIFKVAMEANSK